MIRRSFRTIQKFLVPTWLSTGEGELVGYSLDLMKDAFVERVRLGLLARLPQNGPNGETAPEDALAAIGRDRRLYRGINETAAVYAARLVRWLDDWKEAGTAFALMKQLHAYIGTANGVSFRVVDVRGNWYSRSASGVETRSLNTGNWNWDGASSRWSRFWVIVYPGTMWTAESTWGAGTWGATSSGTLGSTVTPDQASVMRAIVAEWKPEGTRGEIILALDDASFDSSAPEPDGLWAKFYKYVTGDAVASRLETARYFGV